MSMILFRNDISGLGVLLPDASWGGTESSGIPSDVQVSCWRQRDPAFEQRNLGVEANWPNWSDIRSTWRMIRRGDGKYNVLDASGKIVSASTGYSGDGIANKGYTINNGIVTYWARMGWGQDYFWVPVCQEEVGAGAAPCDPYCQEVEKERTMYLSETSTPGSIPIRTIEKTIVCNPPDREVTIPCAEDENVNGGTVPKSPAPLSGLGLEWV